MSEAAREPDLARGVAAELSELLARLEPSRLVLAWSGGADSSVLLHLLRRPEMPPAPAPLAVHVHHGLHDEADAWERHCREQARGLGVEMTAVRVRAHAAPGESTEAAARRARYDALRRFAGTGALLLTAHHRDDQAETVLLQLMRGAGLAGLSAMPRCMSFGGGWLARPMLAFSRAAIRAYALRHELRWVEDSGNDDVRHDRNYLRHRVAPLLRARWPEWETAAARAARHQGEALELLDAEAARYLARCMTPDGRALLVKACAALPAARQKMVLRRWLKTRGLRTPGERQLEYLRAALVASRPRSGSVIAWPGSEVGFYRDRLYARVRPPLPAPVERPWPHGADLELPELKQTLRWRELLRQAPALAAAARLHVGFRRGGEQCARRSGGGCFHQDLKKIFQARGVPPWERDRVPLIHADGRLRLVWGLTACE